MTFTLCSPLLSFEEHLPQWRPGVPEDRSFVVITTVNHHHAALLALAPRFVDPGALASIRLPEKEGAGGGITRPSRQL